VKPLGSAEQGAVSRREKKHAVLAVQKAMQLVRYTPVDEPGDPGSKLLELFSELDCALDDHSAALGQHYDRIAAEVEELKSETEARFLKAEGHTGPAHAPPWRPSKLPAYRHAADSDESGRRRRRGRRRPKRGREEAAWRGNGGMEFDEADTEDPLLAATMAQVQQAEASDQLEPAERRAKKARLSPEEAAAAEVRRQEDDAASAVQRILRKIRSAPLEQREELFDELDRVQSQQFSKMGSRAEEVMAEMNALMDEVLSTKV